MFSWSTKLIINQADWKSALLKDLKKITFQIWTMERKKNSAGFYRRLHGETKYCGLPPPLDLTNPPTYRRVIFFLINGGKDKNEIIGAAS